MRRGPLRPALLGLALIIGLSTAHADRIALVIGNGAYPESPLSNALNDSKGMKTALQKLDFQVIYLENADLAEMDNAVHEFIARLEKDSEGLFYFSGHGAQTDGANYLVPLHASITNKGELKARAYNAGIVLDNMRDRGNRFNLVILDACRDNPFKGFKTAVGGLTSMSGPTGTLIAFASAPDTPASNNKRENNSVYTKHLLRYITEPGLKIEDMLKKVRLGVSEDTHGEQIPWENGSLMGDFCFAGCAGAVESEAEQKLRVAEERIRQLERERQAQAVQPPSGGEQGDAERPVLRSHAERGNYQKPPVDALSLQTSKGFIGIMLPLTGPYSMAAQTVRAGLSAALNADSNSTRYELRFVDTQGGNIGAIYRKLVNEGARFVIGPLLKEEVVDLVKNGDFTVPVLALNQTIEANSRDGIYQFALTPEHEVEQSANLAWFDGYQNALLLAPNSTYGQRMISHFSNYWINLGGKISSVKTYQPGQIDYSDITNAISATKPELTFMIADPSGGTFTPHINNRQINNIPIYATSLIYNGQPKADLSGVTFCDIPWLLNNDEGLLSRKAMQTVVQQTPEIYLRLIAMGIDAYQLIPELNLMKSGGQKRFSGATGVLTLKGNRIINQLHCAQFKGNTLEPRGIAPTLN